MSIESPTPTTETEHAIATEYERKITRLIEGINRLSGCNCTKWRETDYENHLKGCRFFIGRTTLVEAGVRFQVGK